MPWKEERRPSNTSIPLSVSFNWLEARSQLSMGDSLCRSYRSWAPSSILFHFVSASFALGSAMVIIGLGVRGKVRREKSDEHVNMNILSEPRCHSDHPHQHSP